MVFTSPSWVPQLPEVPDSIPIAEFMFNEKYGRAPIAESKDSYTCGLSGRSIKAQEQKDRVEVLAKGLAKELGWQVNQGSEYDKVVGVFALNTIDVMSLNWAIHRINGISSPANAAYNADELRHQLTNAGAKAVFTVQPLLDTTLEAAAQAGIPKERVYLCPMASDGPTPPGHKTLDDLLKLGQSLPALEPLKWTKGQGARQTAFLCYSSGTSGLPKGVMISHRNVIANTLQIKIFDQPSRDIKDPHYKDVALGLLPQSHIYGLVVICHASTYRGDQVVVLPKFELKDYLNSISKHKINTLYIVPPIIIAMVKNQAALKNYNMTSVREIFTGAAPLGEETAAELAQQWPLWQVRQGYGLTETSTVVCSTDSRDIWFGSSGCIIAGCRVKLVDPEGKEITKYNTPGELWAQAPSVVLGYLKNEKSTEETFVTDSDGRWARTGDEAVIRKSKAGNEHVWIVDRIKELIKVKGHQVAPAELEACILNHPSVADCAVIPVPDERAGEIPKAFVVKASNVSIEESDASLIRSIKRHVEKEKAKYKYLTGGVEFIDVIPKSPSGKILRRLLRDKEKAKRAKQGPKL